jgi:hypothetical protein
LLPLIEAGASTREYDPESHYISVQLGERARQRLLERIPSQFHNEQGHHVTLIARPTADDIERFREHVGKQVNFHATHHVSDSDMGVQAVRVRGLEHYSDKPHHHVTISTASGVPAHMSNDLLAQTRGDKIGKWVPLTGRIDITPRTGRLK